MTTSGHLLTDVARVDPSSPRPRQGTRRRQRSVVLLSAVALVATACGGGDDDSDGGATDASTETAPADNSGDDSGVGAGAAGNDIPTVAFDVSALSDTPITAADVRVFDPDAGAVTRLPSVDAVVNTCDVLSAADVGTVATQLSAEESFGEELVFAAGELLTSRCTYQSDNHVIGLIVGSPDQVAVDQLASITPIASGDVTSTPWSDDATVTVLSEDSFGVDTPFAAHVEAGGHGIFVYNSAGTGIDFGSDGEVFARLAAIAAEQVGQAGPPVPVDETANIQTARPCDYWSYEELQAFLDPDLADIVERPNTDQAICEFGDFNDYTVRIEIERANGFDASSYDASAKSDAVFSSARGNAYFVAGDSVVEVSMSTPFVEDDGWSGYVDARSATVALAENLASRYQG